MQGYPCRQFMESVCLAATATTLFACAPRSDSAQMPVPNDTPTTRVLDELAAAEPVTTTYVDARPAALVQGRVVDWGEMRPLLNEAAGATVLREVTLDRMLAAELLAAGITISTDDVDRERKLFYETLSPEPDVAVRLARELRARQGLGRHRFDRLLRRNAGLRALVVDRVQVTDEAVMRTYEIFYGPRRQARLLVAPTLAAAQAAIDRIEAGEPFADVAVEVSTDASAARGGLLAPISQADPSYPQVMRDALWGLGPGEISAPVFLGEQYAVLTLVREIEADPVSLGSVRADLRGRVRLNQERMLMDQLARRLLTEANVTIIDDALKESWDFGVRAGFSLP